MKRDDYNRSIAYGEASLGQIKRNTLPAYPRNYELWYTYCAGFNQALNRAINDVLRSKKTISATELDIIYEKHLSPKRLGDRIDAVGERMSEEIHGISSLIEATLASTSDFCESLAGASSELGQTTDQAAVSQIVSRLLVSTRDSEAANRRLEAQLAESRREIAELQQNLDAIRFESLTDELTTLANRKHFDQSIERALFHARENRSSFVLLMTDIDHFKTFNDRYGHQTGDQVLRLVALAMKQNIKGQDIACRYGGEEFAIILPRTRLEQGVAVAEHIRNAVVSKELVKRSTGENLGHITVSVGAAAYRDGDTARDIIERADKALYVAKNTGRNKVASEEAVLRGPGDTSRSVA